MGKMLKVVLAIILASGLLIISYSVGCSPGGSIPAPSVGSQAPDFNLPGLGGQSISLSDFRGKPVLINFWATWCPPCRDEMPYLQEVYEEWSDKGLVVLTIDIGDPPAQVEEFMASLHLSLPVLLDMQGNVAQKYNVQFYPTTFFIDKEGIIQDKVIGAFQNKAQIEKRLGKIMP